jgi:hypothetical protein
MMEKMRWYYFWWVVELWEEKVLSLQSVLAREKSGGLERASF